MSSSENSNPTKLVIIDGNAIMHRAYHALPPLTTTDGEPINAVYGLVSMLIRLVSELKPTHLAVCFDRPEPTFRKIEYEAYQSHRPETDKELSGQFQKAREVLGSMKIGVFEKAGFEADDLIGTLSGGNFDETVIVTGDRDILQLVDDRKKVAVFMPVKGLSEGKIYKEEDVVDRMGVVPEKIVDYKALVGDPSDNYPGIAGIGPKTAEKLIEQYGSFAEIYKHIEEIAGPIKSKLEKGKESGEISLKLAKIVRDVDFDFDTSKLDQWDLASEDVISMFNKIGFKTLLTRTIKAFGGNEKPRTRKKLTKTDVEKVVAKLSERLKNKQYAIRGTASLQLQDIVMGVDDIDLVCDQKTADFFNIEFRKELVKKIEYSESDKYKSFFGQFVFEGILFEVMGEFQFKNSKGMWSEIYDGRQSQVNVIKIEGKDVPVTRPEVELEFSAGVGRWNEFHKIKRQIETKNQSSLF